MNLGIVSYKAKEGANSTCRAGRGQSRIAYTLARSMSTTASEIMWLKLTWSPPRRCTWTTWWRVCAARGWWAPCTCGGGDQPMSYWKLVCHKETSTNWLGMGVAHHSWAPKIFPKHSATQMAWWGTHIGHRVSIRMSRPCHPGWCRLGGEGKLGEEPSIMHFVKGFINHQNRKISLTMMALRAL